MEEMTWKRTKYDTWDDAFSGLLPQLRQQSLRVAHYTRAIYVEACVSGFAAGFDNKSAQQVREDLADVAYKCGMYHQIGKALVPHEYQIEQKDFTAEEQAVYRKYTTDGAILVKSLEEKTAPKSGIFAQKQNIPSQMLTLACEEHMERYSGEGYPKSLSGNSISPIGQIVGLAKELDRLSSETKSEKPFDEAIEKLCENTDGAFSESLLVVLSRAKKTCEEVYKKYIYYTQTLPKTIPLVKNTENPPMGLLYKPMIEKWAGEIVSYEAVPYFIEDGKKLAMEEVEAMLSRSDLLMAMVTYLLYTAGDTIYRFQNYKLKLKSLVFPMPLEFIKNQRSFDIVKQMLDDEGISKKQLIFAVKQDDILMMEDADLEALRLWSKKGLNIMADYCDAELLSVEKLKDLGIKYLRLKQDANGDDKSSRYLDNLKLAKVQILGTGADTRETMSWLENNSVSYMSGVMAGLMQTEDELFRAALMKERDI